MVQYTMKMRLAAMLVALVGGFGIFAVEGRALAAGQVVADSFGGRSYKLYVPSSYSGQKLPLVLMLHGCTQDPDQFIAGTNMNAVAEAHGFFALYPDEPTAVQQLKCWQWWDPAHQMRGAGEPAALVALIDHVGATYAVDDTRTFAAGLSAGAAMTVILGATYPDRFSSIVVAAGVEYGAANSSTTAPTVSFQGGPDPTQQGHAAASAMAAAPHPVRVMVVHGTADAVVAPLNGDQVVAQWSTTDALVGGPAVTTTPATMETGQVAGGRSYTITHHGAWVHKIAVDGMGHAWPGAGGSGMYSDVKGPDASELAWAFFTGSAPSVGGGMTPGANPPGATMPHGGCDMGGGGTGGGLMLFALLMLAARKRATPSSWIRSSGSSSSSPRRS